CGVRQAGSGDDVQATFGEYLGTQLRVVAFQTNHNRYFNADFFNRTDDALCDHVAANDTTEDVNQNGLYRVVRQDDLERFGYTLFGCAATYVQEVGRLAAGQLDNVHGTHGQACTVNHAADVAFQRNVVEL